MSTDSKFACLTYHAIGNESTQYVISEDLLRNQLEFLSQEGFVVEGFEQLESRIRSNRIFPRKYVLLTVDDGHESTLRAADLLESCGCNATFFPTRDRALGKPGYLRPEEMRELRRRGASAREALLRPASRGRVPQNSPLTSRLPQIRGSVLPSSQDSDSRSHVSYLLPACAGTWCRSPQEVICGPS